MRRTETNKDRGDDGREAAATLALGALAWVIGDGPRADRFLSLTGIDPDDLRARAGDPALLAQVLAYLEGHEPDLVACADALGVAPAALVTAHARLES